MATLGNKSVKATLRAVFRYNNNPDKNRPVDGLYAAAAYIRGDHSIERLYSRGHNGCSCNPELAVEQFRASEALYRQKKAGAREAGLTAGKRPTIAEHLFISFPDEENVSYQTQCEIADKLCASPLLENFYAISNRHYNTDNDHTHILVSNYAKDGSKKLSLNNNKRNELRKELDRICVSYGLSIIDDPALRVNDPEREAFVRQIVEDGQAAVYVPADYKRLYKPDREYDRWMLAQVRDGRVLVARGVSKNRECSQAEAYRRWIAEQPNFIREKDKSAAKQRKAVLISEEDKKGKAARVYYWDDRYKHKDYYYAVRRYDDRGYHKPTLVLIFELLLLVCTNEQRYFEERYPQADFGPTNWKVQHALDAMRYREEQDVRTPVELSARIEAVGKDLAEARKGHTYYMKAIENGEDLYRAIAAFNTKDAPEEVRREAYRIMAAHKCTEPDKVADFMKRRQFAEKKVKDLDEQIERLRKDYHDLKFIESQEAEYRVAIERYVWENAGSHSLDDLLNRAKTSQNETSKKIEKNSEKFQKKY